MTNAEKRERNRAYYLKNRERILSKARARNGGRGNRQLSLVPGIDEACREAGYESMTENESAEIRLSSKLAEKLTSRVEAETSQPSWPEIVVAKPAETLRPTGEQESLEVNLDLSTYFQQRGFQMQKDFNVVWLLPQGPSRISETNVQRSATVGSQSEKPFKRVLCSPTFQLRLAFVICLNLLMIAMQVAFYREHDILPEFALPLAVVSELAFISLVSMKFRRGLEWIRVVSFLAFYGYFVGALSFHVYGKTRITAASQQLPTAGVSKSDLDKDIDDAKRSLEAARKGRSWANIELFGKEVFKLQEMKRNLPEPQFLGTSIEQFLYLEMILLVLLRALLMVAGALNAIRLREQLSESIASSCMSAQINDFGVTPLPV